MMRAVSPGNTILSVELCTKVGINIYTVQYSQKSVSSFCMSTQTFYLFLVAIHRLEIQKMSLSVTDVFVKNRNQIQMG